nr:MAG TPA: hypothetical protein [Caudoviricetes sp.]
MCYSKIFLTFNANSLLDIQLARFNCQIKWHS